MRVNEVLGLYKYNKWANEALLNFLGGIEFEKLTRNMGSSFGSVRDTLVHILGAEELWLSRWMEQGIRGLLKPDEFDTYVSLTNRWAEHSSRLLNYLEGITNYQLMQEISYTNLQGINYTLELWKQMLHIVNHSSYQRGQVVTMARQINLKPPSLDLIYYYLQKK